MSTTNEALAPPAAAPAPVSAALATTKALAGTTQSKPQERDSRAPHRDGRTGGGRGRPNGKRNKNMGRNDYTRMQDESKRTAKRLKMEGGQRTEWKPREGVADEDKEERKPKRKVAVMLSYCGTGYKGMQLNPPFKSIEGDLFEAFVKAGAISRANSDDPKKSALVRCARTDKGVHAAGNVISLKLIIEDPDVIQKINANLPAQIRVWDIIRTTGSFSCYNLCDSRKYEYLLPTHVFLPPQPKSWLASHCRKYAEKEGDLEGFLSRQKEVEGWWPEVMKKTAEHLKDEPNIESLMAQFNKLQEDLTPTAMTDDEELYRKIMGFQMQQKRAYRISPERLERVREAFRQFVGTNNFWNYTIDKSFKDPSANRHIKSFEVSDPIIINGTEWLSIHVHGQSFMMHQIRKMVGMAMMVVRCGTPVSRIKEAFGPRKISIGKAPSLGLLLEYPLFEHYNAKMAKENDRAPLDFAKYQEQVDKFKQEFIYDKIFDQEQKENTFTSFVQYLDTFRNSTYMYLTSAGFKAIDDLRANGELEWKDATQDDVDVDSEGELAGATEEG